MVAKVLDLLLDAVCVVDRDGRFVMVSAAFERIFGYRPDEVVGRPMIELVHPDDRERTLQAATEIVGGQPKIHFRNRYLRKDGGVVDVMWSARWSESDQVRIAVARDVTALSRSESRQAAVYAISEAAHAAEDLVALLRQIHTIVTGLLPAGNFLVALRNGTSERLGFPYAVVQGGGETASSIREASHLCAEVIRAGQPLPSAVGAQESAHFEWLGVPLRSHAGVIGALLVQSLSERARYSVDDRELLQYVSLQVGTVIERKRAEERLQHAALHDVLTDLPNRRLFHDRLSLALSRARRHCTRMGLLFVDLDGFKQVNDEEGHMIGDRLLCEVARRLRQCVRESDTVARMGGDEFTVVLDCLAEPGHAAIVAEKIRAALVAPFELDGRRVQLSSSIGIALHPEHGHDTDSLLRRADEAMYLAKQHGRNRVWIADGVLAEALA